MKVKLVFNEKQFEVGDVVTLAKDRPLKLTGGKEISNFNIAYQTYGSLNQDKSNAILICHALTGDQYAASTHPVTGKKGWWDFMIGEGKAIDTNQFFVIVSNVIGGCMGSFGPRDINPETNQQYGLDFPFITISDMVNVQNLLIEHFGIKKLHAVIGGSMGGMQVLAWANLYPHKIKAALPISCSYRHSPQNIAFHEVGRQAIMADPNWCNGKYFLENKHPHKGLALARMTAHITYLSEDALQKKFGRNLQDKRNLSFNLDTDFQIESYLHHQGFTFVERFDANSYLYITKAVDYFDLETDNGGKLSNAFIKCARISAQEQGVKFCVISFSDDWLFPTNEMKKIVKSLAACGIDVSSVDIKSTAGHDSFLVESEDFKNTVHSFLASIN